MDKPFETHTIGNNIDFLSNFETLKIQQNLNISAIHYNYKNFPHVEIKLPAN